MKLALQVSLLLMMLLGFVLAGCAGSDLAPSPSATPSDLEIATSAPTESSHPLPTPTHTSTPVATPTRVVTEPPLEEQLNCGETFCQVDWPGILMRPFSEEFRTTTDPTYPYASTKAGLLDVHHGVEFPNAFGTPVRAAAAGEVVFAGGDDLTLIGPYTGFYGNVVILSHPDLYQGRDLFSLYAHLSEIAVSEGDQLGAGEVLGQVGASGAADGSHLHFEVRLDENAYSQTMNPILWFSQGLGQNEPQSAVLTGTILDRFGNPLPEFEFVLERRGDDGDQVQRYYPVTYVSYGVNSHPLLEENFAVPDLPPGDYRMAFIAGRFYEFEFTLRPGELGIIRVQVD